jgi:hypothetical protein
VKEWEGKSQWEADEGMGRELGERGNRTKGKTGKGEGEKMGRGLRRMRG